MGPSEPAAAAAVAPPLVLLEGALELRVPLAVGTLQWGTTWIDDRLINGKGVISDATCRDILDLCAAAGVTLFDTAEGYGGGTSEKRLGRLLAAPTATQDPTEAGGTQPGRPLLMTKFLPAPWRGVLPGDMARAAADSCRRLGVPCIDVYLLHSPVHWRPLEYWVAEAAACHKRGLIRAMGLSNCNADQVRRAVAAGRRCGVPVVCNQVHYSLLDYNSAALRQMEATCRELGVAIVGFSPLGQGLLTDHLTPEALAGNKPAKMLHLTADDLEPLRATLVELARDYDKTMAQVALNWCVRHGVVPLVGCRSATQARDSLGALGWALRPGDVARLDAAALDRSTLEGPAWRRALCVALFGAVMVACRTLDWLGYGAVAPALEERG